MYTLKKNFRFEAAHRLAKGYEGKCANIHGHSWNGVLALRTEKLDHQDMSIDFYKMGEFVKKIENELDHTILLQHDDTDLIKLCVDNKWKHVIFTGNPTCEIIAEYIAICAKEFFGAAMFKSITIKETCTTACTYE